MREVATALAERLLDLGGRAGVGTFEVHPQMFRERQSTAVAFTRCALMRWCSLRTLVCMRTTVVLDDGLLEDAKKFVAANATTLSGLIAEALRATIAQARALEPSPTFELVWFKGEGLNPASV